MAQVFHVKEEHLKHVLSGESPVKTKRGKSHICPSSLIQYQVEFDKYPEGILPFDRTCSITDLPERIILYSPENKKAVFLFRHWLQDPDKYLFSNKERIQPGRKVKSSQLSRIGPIMKK